MMEYRGKKYCFVPFCGANRKLNPDRIFFLVPKEKFMRDLWIKAAKRNASITGPNTMFYCCQDHFDLELDMENYKKYMENTDKVRPVLKRNVVPHRFDCLDDLPPGSDMRKRRMMTENEQDQIDDVHLSYIASICNGEEVTRLTLDEMNKLLLDINNLGVLGDVLNAYSQVYHQMAWNLDFMVENSSTWYNISVKKAADKQTMKDQSTSADSLETGGTMNKRRRVHSNSDISTPDNCSDVESVKEYNRDDTQSALLDGGHIYTKTLSSATVHPRDGHSDDILPKHRVHTVYQCEYCCYGSLEKYCLKHHIHSRHSARFKACVKNEIGTGRNVGEKNLESADEILRKPSDKKAKPLPYYMPRDKSLTELTRLSKEVKRKKKWLEDFIESLSHNKNKDVKHKQTNKIYACTLCDFTGCDQTAVYKHIGLSHTNETSVFCECPICGDNTEDRKSLLVHLRDSHPGKNTLQCSQCRYNTGSTQLFFRHVLEVHKRVKHFKCNDCSFSTARKANLVKHINVLHKRGRLPCPEEGCQFKAAKEESLKSHTMIIHEGLRPFSCSEPECNYAAGKQFALNKHISMAHKTPTFASSTDTTNTSTYRSQGKINCIYVCTQCGNKFNHKQALDKHIAKCHLGIIDSFRCGYCTFTSTTKPTMDIHIREIHKGYLPFKCDKCDFKTSLKNKFQTHYNVVHLKQKPHNCSHCDMSFSLKPCAIRHIQDVHLKEKPHLCGYCQFSTAHKANLKSHLKSIHNVSQEHLPQVLKNCVDLRSVEERDIITDSLLICGSENLQCNHDVGNIQGVSLEQVDTLHHEALLDEQLCHDTLQGEELCHDTLQDEELGHDRLPDEELGHDTLQDHVLKNEIILDEELQDDTLQVELKNEIILDEDLQDDTLQVELKNEIILDDKLQGGTLQDELKNEIILGNELQDDTLQGDELQDEILLEEELQDNTLQDQELQDEILLDEELQGKILLDEELQNNILQQEELQDDNLQEDDDLDGDNTEILHNIDLVIEG